MIDLNFVDLDKYIRDRCTSQVIADKVLTYGIGFALGRVTDIPGRKDVTDNVVFEENARVTFNTLVNEFNEKLPSFDIDAAIELGRFVWLLRYRLSCIGPDSVMEFPVVESKAPFIVSYAGMSGEYNHHVQDFCNQNQTVLTSVINRCMGLMQGIIDSLHK